MINNTTHYDKTSVNYFQKEHYGFNRLLLWSILAAVLCIFVTLYSLITQPHNYIIMCIIFGSLMFLIVISLILISLNYKHIAKSMENTVYHYMFDTNEFKIEETENDEGCQVDYSMLKLVVVNNKYVYFYIDKVNAFIIDRKGFVNPTDLNELLNLVANNNIKITFKNKKAETI